MFSNSNCASVPLVANIDGNGNNGGWADGGWLWIIVVFALLFGWGNGGFGGFGGNNGGGYVATAATQADIQRGFDNSAVISKLDGISNGLCDGFYAMNNSMLTGFNGINTILCRPAMAYSRLLTLIQSLICRIQMHYRHSLLTAAARREKLFKA